MDAFGRLPTTVTGFLLCALLEALVILEASSLIPGAEEDTSMVIECVGFPSESQRQSISHVRLFTLGERSARLALNFLDVDGSVLATRHVELARGGATSFEVKTWQIGSALQIIASAPVGAEVVLIYDGSIGPPERRTVPCWRATSPQPTAGVLRPP
jgi:hypothetical protein